MNSSSHNFSPVTDFAAKFHTYQSIFGCFRWFTLFYTVTMATRQRFMKKGTCGVHSPADWCKVKCFCKVIKQSTLFEVDRRKVTRVQTLSFHCTCAYKY